MTRDEVVSILVERLGNRPALIPSIIMEMQISQAMKMEQNGKFQPWFLTTEYAIETTEVGENRIPLPDDFLMEVEEKGLWIKNSEEKWVPLKKRPEDELTEFYGDTPAAPKEYALTGLNFLLFPVPDAAYQIRFKYIASQEVLNSDVENNWLKYAPDLMIALVGHTLSLTRIQNPQLAASFEKEISPAWDRLFSMHEARAHTNTQYTKGDSR